MLINSTKLVWIAAITFSLSATGSIAESPPKAKPPPTHVRHFFTATIPDGARRQGAVDAAGMKWTCRKDACTVLSSRLKPTVADCRALQQLTGLIGSFGNELASLTDGELKECNEPAPAPNSATSWVGPEGTIGRSQSPDSAINPPSISESVRERDERFRAAVRRHEERVRQQQETEEAERRRREAEWLAPPGASNSGPIPLFLDCNDSDPAIHPGQTEQCNGRDDNCDGRVDEGVTVTYYLDADGDSHGNPHETNDDCPQFQPESAVQRGNDCDDTDPKIWRDCSKGAKQ